MSTFDTLAPDEQARLETAAAWSARLAAEPHVELASEFQSWIAEPANARALEQVETMRAALDEFRATPKILDMRRAALKSFRNASARRWLPVRALARIAATVVVLAASGGAWLYVRSTAPASYATDVGERRLVALSDGSRISLDSDSAVHVRYTQAARTVVLDRGRARFDVAHDTTRPFTVTAGTETVVAVGTSFDVERLGQKVVVTLIQGRVLIKDAAPPAALQAPAKRTVSLVAGEELVATRAQKPFVAHADLDAATAWESGHLVFLGETLAEAVQRVNRYTAHPIAVDPSAASIRISGVFNAGDVGTFVAAITAYFPVEATTNDDNTITLQHR